MDIQARKGYKAEAAEALSHFPKHKNLVLLSTGAAAGLSLLVAFLSFILEEQIADTGGLAGLGLRSVLSTVQTLLSFLSAVVMPFWTLGFLSATVRLSRREAVGYNTLLDGFRRFGPALRLYILRCVIYLLLAFISVEIGSTIFTFTPFADTLFEMLSTSDFLTTGVLEIADTDALIKAMLPMLLIALGIYALLVIPVSYRLRLADMRIVDDPKCGAFTAALGSNRVMRHNCMELFRLDLSFWWYYLGELLVLLLCYGDMLLPLLGITLPFSENLAYFLFYIAGMLAQLALHWYALSYVNVTYARFYDALRPREA